MKIGEAIFSFLDNLVNQTRHTKWLWHNCRCADYGDAPVDWWRTQQRCAKYDNWNGVYNGYFNIQSSSNLKSRSSFPRINDLMLSNIIADLNTSPNLEPFDPLLSSLPLELAFQVMTVRYIAVATLAVSWFIPSNPIRKYRRDRFLRPSTWGSIF